MAMKSFKKALKLIWLSWLQQIEDFQEYSYYLDCLNVSNVFNVVFYYLFEENYTSAIKKSQLYYHFEQFTFPSEPFSTFTTSFYL